MEDDRLAEIESRLSDLERHLRGAPVVGGPEWSGVQRVAAYIRTSRGDQSDELQKYGIERFVDQKGWEIVGWYGDVGVSGRTAHRPKLRRLLKDAKESKFDAVVVWRSDRLFRSLKQMLQVLDHLQSCGVDYVSISEPFNYRSPEGRLVLQLCSAFSEFELNLNSVRTKAGMAAARRRGVAIGRPSVVLDRFEVLKLRKEGKSYREIAETLNCGASTVRRSVVSWKAEDTKRGLDIEEIGW